MTNEAHNKLVLGTAMIAAFVFVLSIVFVPSAATVFALLRLAQACRTTGAAWGARWSI